MRYPYYLAPARRCTSRRSPTSNSAGVMMWFGGGLIGALGARLGGDAGDDRRRAAPAAARATSTAVRPATGERRAMRAVDGEARTPRVDRPHESATAGSRSPLSAARLALFAVGAASAGHEPRCGTRPASARDPSARSSQTGALCSSLLLPRATDQRQGIPGRGPSLRGVGALAADFYLETGTDAAAVAARGADAHPAGVPQARSARWSPTSRPSAARRSRPSRRARLALEGQSCSRSTARAATRSRRRGGIVTGAVVPALNAATPRQIAEAIRIGPYVMPRFGPGELSEAEIDSIARYVQSTQRARGSRRLGHRADRPDHPRAWSHGCSRSSRCC